MRKSSYFLLRVSDCPCRYTRRHGRLLPPPWEHAGSLLCRQCRPRAQFEYQQSDLPPSCQHRAPGLCQAPALDAGLGARSAAAQGAHRVLILPTPPGIPSLGLPVHAESPHHRVQSPRVPKEPAHVLCRQLGQTLGDILLKVI